MAELSSGSLDIKGTTQCSRRKFLRRAAGSGLLVASAGLGGGLLTSTRSFAQTPTAAPVIETVYGKVRGLTTEGISAFKGMNYGADTSGANRFLPAKRPDTWGGIRNAFEYGDSCPQFNNYLPCYQDGRPQSENCLVINVWSPAAGDREANLPVMVWFHGGAFENESASEWIFDGHNLSKAGEVVLVTLNHRLNLFGYADVVAKGPEAVNVGQLDLVAALQWVRENIRNFGGNPDNVTIFGESGGGGKVSAIMAMPAAQGLFHKAIVQSGSFLTAASPDDAAQVADKICELAGVRRGDLSALQALTTDKLRDVYIGFSKARWETGKRPKLGFAPIRDGVVLPRDPWAPTAPPGAANIPMMIGTTYEEAAFFIDEKELNGRFADDGAIAAAAAQAAILSDIAPEKFNKIVKVYRRAMPELDAGKLVIRIATDAGMWRNAVKQAERKVAAGGTPAFMYEIEWAFPMLGGSWAVHGIDLPMVFGNIDMIQCYDDQDSREKRADADPDGNRYLVSQQTMKAWSSFARSGDPSTANLAWPSYDLSRRATMIFDKNSRVVNDPRAEVRKALMSV